MLWHFSVLICMLSTSVLRATSRLYFDVLLLRKGGEVDLLLVYMYYKNKTQQLLPGGNIINTFTLKTKKKVMCGNNSVHSLPCLAWLEVPRWFLSLRLVVSGHIHAEARMVMT